MNDLIDVIALILIYFLVFFRRWKAKGKDILLINTVMYVYLCFVMYFTLMPVITSIPGMFKPKDPDLVLYFNMVSFVDVQLGRGDYFNQIFLNVLMMVPFGFILPIVRKRGASFFRTVLYTFLISLGIEITQLFISIYRSSDITDIITNTTGGAIGYLFYMVLRPVTTKVLTFLNEKLA